MAFFYRGAGIGTYWHDYDAREKGFQPQDPGADSTVSRIMQHIARGTTNSPYVSLTRSYGVALGYATFGRTKTPPSAERPVFVYEIEIDESHKDIVLVDPLVEITKTFPHPAAALSYQHDGSPSFLLSVIDPQNYAAEGKQPCPRPPGDGSTERSPTLTTELEAILRALRDAEILVHGGIPRSRITKRIEVY